MNRIIDAQTIFFSTFILLPLLSIFSGVFGLSATLTTSIIAVFCIFTRIRNLKNAFGIDSFIILTLFLMMAVSLLYTSSFGYGQRKTLIFGFLILPWIYGLQIFLRNSDDFKKLFNILFASLLFLTILGFFSSLVTGATGSFSSDYRVSTTLDLIANAQYMGLACLVFLLKFIFIKRHNLFSIFAIGLLFLMALYQLLITGTRTPVYALVFVIFLAVFFWNDSFNLLSRIRRNTLRIILFIFVIPSAFFILTGIIDTNVLSRLSSLNSIFSQFNNISQVNYNDLSYGRAIAWNLAILAFTTNPIFGLGVGGFRSFYDSFVPIYLTVDRGYSDPVYPHNIILEVAAELGIVALILILWLVLRNIYHIFRHSKIFLANQPDYFLLAASIFLYGFIIAQSSLDITGNIIFWYGLGLWISMKKVFHSRT